MGGIREEVNQHCSFIDRYQTEPIHSFSPKREPCEEFTAHVAKFMESAVWTDNCRNSHNGHAVGGRIPTTWPGSTLHYLEAMREVRGDDWEIKYEVNRFSWLGNGISQTEWDATADLAYYIRQGDDGVWASRRKRTLRIAKSGSMPPRMLHRQAKLGVVDRGVMGLLREVLCELWRVMRVVPRKRN